ncbi:hypothetical protein GA0070622_3251 [Micromonospora sediminicola]|uniref:Uncharacterized protein n=1 Tax=Micromonospora sediminicola TaxID=946078 RepID=A0A1A9BB74_9ACTN|nr:hypothetical protein [Micromonospora sediminicola]SBT66234.1 hypothetical protein GA0070622_3251 [Micromonospora sediminicola]
MLRLRPRRAAVVAVLALLTAGCSTSGADPDASGPGTSASGSNSSSTDASGAGAPGAARGGATIAPGTAGTTSVAPSPAARTGIGARPSASAGPCAVFPADNVWHADVTRLPVHARSAAMVGAIGADAAVHADFGSGTWEGAPIGIPVTVVPAGQRRVPVTFGYADESDSGPYPIPPDAKVEGGPSGTGDRHVIVWDRGACRAYELFDAHRSGAGWRAGSGAVFDLRSNRMRRAGWTSADAAGLSVLAGLVRYDEVAAGRIDHAIRVTVPRTRTGWTWPASHSASSATDPALPQLGQRLRLKRSVDLSGLPRQARIVAEAMRRHGLIVADHGSAWYISGAPDPRWDNDALHALDRLRGGDFEVVDAAGLMVAPTSAATR